MKRDVKTENSNSCARLAVAINEDLSRELRSFVSF